MSQPVGRKTSVIYKVYQYLTAHPVLFYSIVSIATLIICFRVYLRGNAYPVFFDVGSDTSAQYVPYMNLMGMSFGNGSFWNDRIGLGLDMINLQSWTMDFFNLPAEIFFSLGFKEAAFFSITVMFIVRCYLCGLFALFFLRCFRLSKESAVFGAYACSLSGFICLWGQHYFFSTACVFLMLIFFLIEKSIREKKDLKYLVVAVALCLVFSVYISYMIGLAVTFYLVFRLLVIDGKFKEKIFKFGHFWSAAVIAGLISSVISVPAVYQLITVTDRVTDGGVFERLTDVLMTFYDRDTLVSLLLRLYSNNLQGDSVTYEGILNYYENIQLFCTCLVVPFTITMLVDFTVKSKKKILMVIAFMLGAYTILTPVLPWIFNMCTAVSYRFSFVLLPVFAYALAYVVSNRSELSKSAVITLVLVSLASAVFIIKYSVPISAGNFIFMHMKYVKVMTILVAAIIVSCSRLMGAGRIKGYVLRWGLPAILMLSALDIIADNSVTLNNRVALTKEVIRNNEYAGDDTAETVAMISSADEDYYRIEKTYSGGTYFNGSMTWDYPGVSYYIGTYNKHVQSFFRTFWPEAVYGGGTLGEKYVVYEQDPANDVLNELLGIRYVMDKGDMITGSEDMILYVPDVNQDGADSNGDITIYQNKAATGFGMLYTSAVSESGIQGLDDKLSFRDKLDRYVVLEDAAIVDIEQKSNVSVIDNIESYCKDNVIDDIEQNKNNCVKDETGQNDRIFVTDDMEQNANVTDDVSAEDNKEQTDARRDYNYDRINAEKALHVEVYKPAEGTYTCSADADTDAILFLPISYDEGWTAMVNGEKAKVYRADLGFIGILLSSGNNDIVLSYRTPYLNQGLIMTIAGVVLYLIFIYILNRKSEDRSKS